MDTSKTQWVVIGMLITLALLEAIIHPSIKNMILNFAHNLNAKSVNTENSNKTVPNNSGYDPSTGTFNGVQIQQ